MKKLLSLLFLFLAAMLSGRSNQFADSIYYNDQEIAKEYSSFDVQGMEQNIQNNRFKCKATMAGMELIWSYDAEKAEDVDINYSLKVAKGKAKLVLIKPDGTIETIVEQIRESKADDYTSDVLHVERGENRIKLVTLEGTKFEFDILISEGEFWNLGL